VVSGHLDCLFCSPPVQLAWGFRVRASHRFHCLSGRICAFRGNTHFLLVVRWAIWHSLSFDRKHNLLRVCRYRYTTWGRCSASAPRPESKDAIVGRQPICATP